MIGHRGQNGAKSRLRRIAAAQRDEAAHRHGREAGEAIARHGLELLASTEPGCVSGYWPVRGEIDDTMLLQALTARGWRVYLPAIAEADDEMAFRRWQPGAVLSEGLFRIPEPPPEAEVADPEVLLVPLLAFDTQGYRLGYGGGYYDRKLGALRAGGQITAIGLAYDEQEVAKVPREPHDQRLDWIVTPSGAHLTRAP